MKVVLKKMTLDDRADFVEVCNRMNRTYTSERMPYPFTMKNAADWIINAERFEGINGISRLVMVDGECCGAIWIEQMQDIQRIDSEIAYMLNEDKWSRGIMTEAVRQICELAFDCMDIRRISAMVQRPNEASIKVLEKNGFVLEGIMKNAVIKRGEVRDICVYAKYR